MSVTCSKGLHFLNINLVPLMQAAQQIVFDALPTVNTVVDQAFI